MKGKKGITLIALIITIIVILILVAVTINVAISSGLFGTAKKAARKTNKAKFEEEMALSTAALNTKLLINPVTNGEISKRPTEIIPELFPDLWSQMDWNNIDESDIVVLYNVELLKEIIQHGFEVDAEYILPVEDTEFEILDTQKMSTNGMVGTETNSQILFFVPAKYKGVAVTLEIATPSGDNLPFLIDVNNIIATVNTYITNQIPGEEVTVAAGENIKEITEEGVPIPKGFYYVTGTKDTGVVISDNQLDANQPDGNNGNQFVWVPVRVNPKLEIKIDTFQDMGTVRILNAAGYDETFNVNSDMFEKTITLAESDVYEIIITYKNGEVEHRMIYANNAYKFSNDGGINPVGIKEMISFMRMIATAGDDVHLNTDQDVYDYLRTQALEDNPDLVLNTNIDLLRIAGGTDLINVTCSDAQVEADSVLNYGGFYIGRYEAGTDGSVRKGITPENNITYNGAKVAAEAMYNDTQFGVKSSLISWGSWNRVMNWLVETGSKTYYDIAHDANSWGNWGSGGLGTNNSSLKSSGSSDTYLANNIYDLSGNVEEYSSMINTETTYCLPFGGSYHVQSIFLRPLERPSLGFGDV